MVSAVPPSDVPAAPLAVETQPSAFVLACISDHPRMVMLMRVAKRHALALGVPWVALHVDTSARDDVDEDRNIRVLQNMTIAEQMGAITHHVVARTPLQGMKDYIQRAIRQGSTFKTVLVGRTFKDAWWQRHLTSMATRLIRAVGRGVEVVSVQLEFQPDTRRPWWQRFWRHEVGWADIGYAVLSVLVATILIEIILWLVPDAVNLQTRNMAIVYMAACAFAASRFGLIPGLVASVLSFVVFSLMYVTPYVRLIINDMSDVMNFVLFIGAAGVISIFCSSTHEQADRMALQVAQLRSLFRLNRAALRKHTRHRVLESLCVEIESVVHTDVAFFLPTTMAPPSGDNAYPPGLVLREDERIALAVCWEEARATGYASPVSTHSRYRFKPMMGSSDMIGVIGIHCEGMDIGVNSLQIFNAVTDLAALIIERMELTTLMEEGRLREEREKLRAMLLSSVSHDLKTPLASVIGGLSVFRSMGERLPQAQRDTLIETALEEAQRLDAFISNILEMTRLESGQIEFKKEWVNVADTVNSVLRRMRTRPRANDFIVSADSTTDIEVRTDSMMAEQMLQNLLDNALKYTPAGTRVDISWHTSGDVLNLVVRDHGAGIPDDQIDKIFDKYTRLAQQDRKVAGTGLGLAIARTTIKMQGGDIKATNHPEGGAIFTVTFPAWRAAAAQVA